MDETKLLIGTLVVMWVFLMFALMVDVANQARGCIEMHEDRGIPIRFEKGICEVKLDESAEWVKLQQARKYLKLRETFERIEEDHLCPSLTR